MTFNTSPNAGQQIVTTERVQGSVHAAQAPRTWRSNAVRTVTSEQLFTGHGEVQIEHRGCVYRLKQTSLGKLILTK